MSNLLQNAGFERRIGLGPRSCEAPAIAGNSAAADWTVWNNSDATTSTNLLPSTQSAGQQMLQVCTTGPSRGIMQMFGASGTGRRTSTLRCGCSWYGGAVGMGTGAAATRGSMS
jgi:hypothetical protein